MPIYEYECKLCGHRMESFQKMTDAPLTHCSKCDKDGLTKLVSAAGFQLKGTGWYVTDFRDKGKKDKVSRDTSSSQETLSQGTADSSHKSQNSADTNKSDSTNNTSNKEVKSDSKSNSSGTADK